MIDGVSIDKSKCAFVLRIETFSDDLKNAIRERLAAICHGQDNASTAGAMYTYRETLKEFFRRYNSKTESTKKGMIGELLTHLLILKLLPSTVPANPYFNLEESSIKKGFDLVLFDNRSQDILITEVKSGSAASKHADSVNRNLLNAARKDLQKRLNGTETHIWINAINGAKVALSNGKIKDAISQILEQCYIDTSDEVQDGKSRDVILVSVVYKSTKDSITLNTTESKRKAIDDDGVFNSVLAVSIQKETYQSVAEFLENEAAS